MKKRYLIYLLLLTIAVGCTPHVHLVSSNCENQKTTAESPTDPSIEEMIQPYKQQMEKEMNVSIGIFESEMTKAKPESTLGNFVADLTYSKVVQETGASVDFAVMNYGGLRVPSIKAGNITRGGVFELMPFDNMLVIMTLDGKTVLQLFEAMANNGGWPVSKQVRYQIKEGKPQNIEINEKPLSLTQTYKVAISDYLANGGDKLSFLKDKPRENYDILLRNAIMEYIEDFKNEPILPVLDGRVTSIN